MDERQQLLACANNCKSLLDDMARREDEYSYLFEKERKFKNRIGWIILGLIFGPLLALVGFIDFFVHPKAIAVSLTITLICLAITVLSVLAIVNHNKRKARMPVIVEEHAALCADPAISWLPPDYRNASLARKIIEYLYNMRAKTLQEAINLLESEKHQATMETLAVIEAINTTRY